MAMIALTERLSIDERALEERFIRASGPGGQHVNKVATAVELRLDIVRAALPPAVQSRLQTVAGSRVSSDGILVLQSREHRTQGQNRAAARARLADLLDEAARPPGIRRPTAPTRASRQRRLDDKRRRARLKANRSPASDD